MILHHEGFPIRKSVDIMLICSSPRLIAACHVLLRLLMPRHSPYALVRLNFLYIVSYTLVLFELSEFLWTFFVQDYWLSFAMKRLFLRLLHLLLSCAYAPSTFRWNCMHTFVCHSLSFGKTNISLKIICPLLFVFYSKILSSIRLSKIFCIRLANAGRSGWTRTIDLALIRRAL